MKIAVLSDTYPPFINGVSTSTFNLVKTLREHGNDVLVITPRSDDGPFEIKDGIVYLPGIELKQIYSYRQPVQFFDRVTRILKDFKPEIIHSQTDGTVGQFARVISKVLRVPFLYTYHTSMEDYTHYVTKGLLDRIAKKLVRGYSKGLAKNSNEFITPSTKTKDYMRSTGSDIFINVIPTGIDFSIFKAENIDKEAVKRFKTEHNITKDTKVFLLLGRLAKEKSMDVSLRGIAEYHNTHPKDKLKVLVVGGGPSREELENLSKELKIDNFTEFLGPKPASEVPFYYHLADIYTSASITETQGLTFMEAMASEAIVLARFDDNLSNTIQDGVNGFFFTDEYSFVKKVEKIFSFKTAELEKIKTNTMKSLDEYSIETFYRRIMEAYRRAIKKYW